MKFGTAKRTFEFTVEKTETYTIRRPARVFAEWCATCGGQVEMSRPDDDAEITGVSTRKIDSGIEVGTTHFTETDDGSLDNGSLMVCIRSIPENPPGQQSLEGELDQS